MRTSVRNIAGGRPRGRAAKPGGVPHGQAAGCPVCEPAVKLVEELACSSCDVTVYDLNFLGAIAAIERYAIKTLPAVAVDGRLVACRAGHAPDTEQLLAAGLGQPLQ